MKFGLFLLSTLPATWAARSVRNYAIPHSLSERAADDSDSCLFPNDYHTLKFTAESSDGTTLSSFSWTFTDDITKITTPCHFNSSSVSTPGNGTPRFFCDDRRIQFIFDEAVDKLWLIEGICLGEDGTANYEVSGSTLIYLTASDQSGIYVANQTDYKALFTSINPAAGSHPKRLVKFRA